VNPEGGPASLTTPSPTDLTSLLDQACKHAGYRPGARLLRHFSNAVYLLDAAPVVVRIGYGPQAVSTATVALAVTRWLVKQGFPAAASTEPPSGADQPLTVSWAGRDTAITFWQYHPQGAVRTPPDSAALGQLAARLHRLPTPPISLPAYEPLQELHAVLSAPGTASVLGGHRHSWLSRRVAELRRAFTDLKSCLGHGLIHADMVTGNLLWNTDTRSDEHVLLCDWDCVSIGPREVDLVPIHHEPRFGAGSSVVDVFVGSYGYDLTQWRGYPVLLEIRELSTLTALIRLAPFNTTSAAELMHRIDCTTRGDRTAQWHAQ